MVGAKGGETRRVASAPPAHGRARVTSRAAFGRPHVAMARDGAAHRALLALRSAGDHPGGPDDPRGTGADAGTPQVSELPVRLQE